eukprot:TRINITY_DN23661_c0_g1_i2.p1 TRINITY_DN23661_c0_g1~~TRINITY_DN23661_c0_g1_i2.p1  ORF type:complete len:205 (-),score=37.97 TRINITY_DN23661_c0_g1_i2:46-660(-)
MSPFFFIFFLLLPLFFCASQRTPETQAEIEALTSIKLSLDDPLGALTGWDPTTPSAPCDWRGIVCSASDGRVYEIRLPRLRLSGPLNPSISNLRQLRKLSLRSNNFNGSLPLSLSNLSRLRALFLQSNGFSGGLPPQLLSNLTNLQVLNLAQNLLSGDIDGILSPNLRYLDLSSNSFSGAIPPLLQSHQSPSPQPRPEPPLRRH